MIEPSCSLKSSSIATNKGVLTHSPSFRKTLIQNSASLSFAQMSNWILPLVALPYILRVLGPSNFGLIAFSQSLMLSLYIFIDYGFSISATRKIAIERGDVDKIAKTACSIWGAQILLGIIGFSLIMLLTTFVPRFTQVKTIFLVMYGYAFGKAFFPGWLFQGLERMIFIPIVNLTANSLVLLGVFLLIKRPEDYLLYAWLLSLGALLTAVMGVVWAKHVIPLKFSWPKSLDIIQVFVEGKTIFLSQMSATLGVINPFIVGLLASNTVVGYYSAGDKIASGVTNLLYSVSQAAYPNSSRTAVQSPDILKRRGKKMLFLVSSLGLSVAGVLFLGAPVFIRLLFGSQYLRSINVLKIVAINPFLCVVSQVCGLQILLPLRKDKIYAGIVWGSSILSFLLSLLLIPRWQECGMALSSLLALFVGCSMMLLFGVKLMRLHNKGRIVIEK